MLKMMPNMLHFIYRNDGHDYFNIASETNLTPSLFNYRIYEESLTPIIDFNKDLY